MAKTTREMISAQIQERILRGTLAPGVRISEVAMAAELGVSRTPLREVFGELVSAGILVRRPTGGVSVKKVSDDEIRSIYEMRRWLEPKAAKAAAACLSKVQKEIIQEACRKSALMAKRIREGAIPPKDYSKCQFFQITEIEIPFHRTQYEATGNTLLVQMMEQMQILERSWIPLDVQSFSTEDYERVVREHENIATAIGAKDGERAAAFALEHAINAYDRLQRLQKEQNATTEEGDAAFRALLGLENDPA